MCITQIFTSFKSVVNYFVAIKDQEAFTKHLYVLHIVPGAFTYRVLCNPHRDPKK